MENMFCFQCEQTARGKGCTGARGVCGKDQDTAVLQDRLTGALIGLTDAMENAEPNELSDRVMIEGLFTTVTNVNFDPEAVQRQIDAVHAEQLRLSPQCAACGAFGSEICGVEGLPVVQDYDMDRVWQADEDVRSVKSLILFGLRGMAAYAYHAMQLGYASAEVNVTFFEGLQAVGSDASMEELLPMALEVGRVNFKCMELLDRANTETYGTPVPTQVPLKIEKGPFIVVSGHDLLDLRLLLEQTQGKGINVYTHGEMLPAHAYPELKRFPHLKGNFGTAWQNQQKEFDHIPAPVLFTTNCLMPVRDSYRDRVFTTGAVAYPGMVHIDREKDFTPVIEKALELGGYPEDREGKGINGGTQVTTGFGHGTVLAAADKVVAAVKSGALRHIFLVGGCDGAKPGRNYYTEFVKETPKDTLVLTLACGKYRFNDLDLGTVAGLPRLMDMGQCNDAYSAVKVASALAEAFGCGINDLPLTLVLSWYEQKAVCILLSLLSLGVQNIYLGPSLPAFLSPHVLEYLVEHYHITPIGTPEKDLEKILKK